VALSALRGEYAPRAGVKSLQIPDVCGGGLTVSFRVGSQQEESNCARLLGRPIQPPRAIPKAMRSPLTFELVKVLHACL